MKSDFEALKNRVSIFQVTTDFYMKPDNKGFVKSPSTKDRTLSLKIYPSTNSFYDFAAGTGGDVVRFVSYVKGVDNWQAVQMIRDRYGLGPRSQDDDRRRQIRLQAEKERLIKERNQEFHDSLFGLISDLKSQTEKYTVMLQNPQIRPLDSLWCYLMREIQAAEYKLDILCASPELYRRMKPNTKTGLSSDRSEWLLDTLQILKAAGRFIATESEMEKIRQAINREANRKPHVRTEGKRAS